MLSQVPDDLKYLLADDTRAYAFLSTIMADGSPQVTPIWFNVEEGKIVINSAKGRTKDKNLRRNPKMAMVIMDLDKPLEYIQIRGEIIDISEEGAREHISTMGQKYQGKNWDPPKDQIRVKYIVRPISIS